MPPLPPSPRKGGKTHLSRLKGKTDGHATDRGKVRLPFPQRSADLSTKGQEPLMETPRQPSGFSISDDFIFGIATFDFGTATFQIGTDTVSTHQSRTAATLWHTETG